MRLVGIDGDDTLWHSEVHFAQAQAALHELISEHVDIERFDAALLATERANVDLYGYGVKSFALSLIETVLDVSGGTVSNAVVGRIIDTAKDLLRHPIELLDDVAAVLPELASRYRLVLVTKGDLFHQEAKVALSGLAGWFEGVEVVAEKRPEDYRRVIARYGVEPEEFVMVGNTLRSDVVPVAEVGGRAVHIPYAITWAFEHAELPAELSERVVRIDSFAQLPGALALLARG